MITIKDIAKAANVSPATVSRVINDGPKVGLKTREHVKRVMKNMGYRPNINARALVNKKSTSLGLVLAELMDPFFATYANAIETVARESSSQLLMSSGSSNAKSERDAIETLLDHRVKAMIVHSKFLDNETLIDIARTVPGFVLINRYIEEISESCVWLDNVLGGYKTIYKSIISRCQRATLQLLPLTNREAKSPCANSSPHKLSLRQCLPIMMLWLPAL